MKKKYCRNCNTGYEMSYLVNSSYAINRSGFWFNCSCGSTLFLPPSVLKNKDIQVSAEMTERLKEDPVGFFSEL